MSLEVRPGERAPLKRVCNGDFTDRGGSGTAVAAEIRGAVHGYGVVLVPSALSHITAPLLDFSTLLAFLVMRCSRFALCSLMFLVFIR